MSNRMNAGNRKKSRIRQCGSLLLCGILCIIFLAVPARAAGSEADREAAEKPVQIKHILRWLRLAGMKILTISQVRTETGVVMAMSMSRRCLPILAGIMIM